jgi:ribosomal protein S18 acetylase RimI-like enzyme
MVFLIRNPQSTIRIRDRPCPYESSMSMVDSSDYKIRPVTSADEPFLWEMLYQGLFVEEGREPYPRDVVNRPHIARYVKDWGRAGDLGFIAIDARSDEPMGAVWCRLSPEDDKGFAYIDEETPELGIALRPEYRGQGIGTALLKRLLEEAKNLYPAISLSVSPNNPALRLYERLGFEIVDIRKDNYPVMKRDLNS